MTPTQLALVRGYVAKNLGQRLGTKELAEVAGMSRSHFCREWRHATGRTIMDYVRAERLAMAMRLIETTNLKLSAIAADCGFASHAHMTETIRQATGRQPSLLRPVIARLLAAGVVLSLALQDAA